MGNITNLKENKTLFIPCSCTSELLAIEYDHNLSIAELAIYENLGSFNYKLSLWQRLRYCYMVLIHKKPYVDQILLNKKQMKDLKKFINSLDIDD